MQNTNAKPVQSSKAVVAKKKEESSSSSDAETDSDSEEVSVPVLVSLGNSLLGNICISCQLFCSQHSIFIHAIFLMRILSLSRIPLLKQFSLPRKRNQVVAQILTQIQIPM